MFFPRPVGNSSCLIATAFSQAETRTKRLKSLFVSVFCFFFSSDSLVVDRCSHNVQGQSSSTAAASLSHTHECTHASTDIQTPPPDTHTCAHIGVCVCLCLSDKHTWRQHTHAVSYSPSRSSSFLSASPAHMCRGTVFYFPHLLHQG